MIVVLPYYICNCLAGEVWHTVHPRSVLKQVQSLTMLTRLHIQADNLAFVPTPSAVYMILVNHFHHPRLRFAVGQHETRYFKSRPFALPLLLLLQRNPLDGV